MKKHTITLNEEQFNMLLKGHTDLNVAFNSLRNDKEAMYYGTLGKKTPNELADLSDSILKVLRES